MAKQTFTTGQILTASQMTSLQQTAMGGGSATAKTASYVLVAADAGTTVIMNAAGATTITVNTSLFSAGDTVFLQNIGAGVSTITAGTATVNTASSLALAQYESGNLYFTAAGASIFSKADGASAAGGFTTAIFHDAKADTVNGGTFTSGAFRTRDLNTSQFNNITSCSLASNQITLPAGSYQIYGSAPVFDVNRHQARFQNITDSSTTILGMSNFTRVFSDSSTGMASIQGAFTITGTKVFEFQHRAESTKASNGFGVDASMGSGEIYAQITISKVA